MLLLLLLLLPLRLPLQLPLPLPLPLRRYYRCCLSLLPSTVVVPPLLPGTSTPSHFPSDPNPPLLSPAMSPHRMYSEPEVHIVFTSPTALLPKCLLLRTFEPGTVAPRGLCPCAAARGAFFSQALLLPSVCLWHLCPEHDCSRHPCPLSCAFPRFCPRSLCPRRFPG